MDKETKNMLVGLCVIIFCALAFVVLMPAKSIEVTKIKSGVMQVE